MSKQLLIIATLDTKGRETEFVKNCAEALGVNPIVMDIGILGDPPIIPNISKMDLAAATGVNLHDLIERKDRAKAVQAMEDGGAIVARRLLGENRLDGVIGTGRWDWNGNRIFHHAHPALWPSKSNCLYGSVQGYSPIHRHERYCYVSFRGRPAWF